MDKNFNERKININMAQIPYIEHKKRIYKAQRREMRLKILLIVTNALWIISASFHFIMR